jgi:putative ABC transport system substrate-binding protein
MPRTGFILALGLAGALIAGNGHAQEPRTSLVGVTAIAVDAEIQAVIDGIRDHLDAVARERGEDIVVEVVSAEADPARAGEIVREFERRDARVIVAITRPSIDAALDAQVRVPIVGAGIDTDTAAQYANLRRRQGLQGVANGATHDDQFAMIRALAPRTRTVAIPIDPDDGDIGERLRVLTAAARNNDFDVVPLPVSVRRNAVGAVIETLDPLDTVALLDRGLLADAPVEALVAATGAQGLPLFASDEESVIRGALAAMVVEPYGIGDQVGARVAAILEAPDTARRPFERARAAHMVVNQEARSLVDLAALEAAAPPTQRSLLDWADDLGPRPRIKPTVPDAPEPLGVPTGEPPVPRERPPVPAH